MTTSSPTQQLVEDVAAVYSEANQYPMRGTHG